MTWRICGVTNWVQGVAGSNPAVPTSSQDHVGLLVVQVLPQWGPNERASNLSSGGDERRAKESAGSNADYLPVDSSLQLGKRVIDSISKDRVRVRQAGYFRAEL